MAAYILRDQETCTTSFSYIYMYIQSITHLVMDLELRAFFSSLIVIIKVVLWFDWGLSFSL